MNLKADLSMKLSDLPEFVKTWKWINYLLFIDTSTYAERQYVIPVLSGSAFIGQLYDAKKDQILHDRFLWQSPVAVNEANITSVKTDTYIEESITDRYNHMSLSASISASLYSGLVEVNFFSY